MRTSLPSLVVSGVEPARIYAAIQTERIMTGAKVKLLGNDDHAVWEMFCEKFDVLGEQKRQ
jgi:hypothetical protein